MVKKENNWIYYYDLQISYVILTSFVKPIIYSVFTTQ